MKTKQTNKRNQKDIMEPLSQIAHHALLSISNGSFASLPQLGIAGLLNDFQYVWNKQRQIPGYDFERLDLARLLCSSVNEPVFKMTKCKSINDIREYFRNYLLENYENDDRIILSLRYEKPRINAEWLPLNEYLDS
jgi:hypothetical protein